MSFEGISIKNALDTLLENFADGRYVVITAKSRSSDAKKIGTVAHVMTTYEKGSFPQSGASYSGPFQHNVTIKIDFFVASPATVNLDVLQDENATDADRAAALAAKINATAIADAKFDELAFILWDIIMRPQHANLGLAYDPSRFITDLEKNAPGKQGALVLVDGTLTMTASAEEYPAGENPVEGTAIDGTMIISADVTGENRDTAAQAVKVGM